MINGENFNQHDFEKLTIRSEIQPGPRARSLLKQQPELTHVINTITITDKSADKISLLIPGIVLSAKTIFHKQIPMLQELGVGIAFADFSNRGFSQQLYNAQLLDLITSDIVKGKTINLIGVSFGSKLIIDFLQQSNPEDTKSIDKVVLFGGLTSIYDLGNPLVSRSIKFIDKYPVKRSQEIFAAFARNNFNTDPINELLARQTGEVKASVNSIMDRTRVLLQPSTTGKIQKKSLLVWWEKERIGMKGKKAVADLFPYNTWITVPNSHGWMASGAYVINPVLRDFLSSD